MESGRAQAQTLEFGAWFDLVIGGAYNQQVQGITPQAEGAGTRWAEMTNAGTQEMVTRIIAAESITRECLGRIVQMQTEINELQKDKEEG